MSLYRVLLVDDEEEARIGIKKKVDWNQCGFEVVGDAENGQEAFELVEKLQPDVVITDIQMPFMNGISLSKKLHERYPTIKVIIFSGYDDFEYAHQAIKYNVMEYILKPVSALELAELLYKVREELNKEYTQRQDIEKLRAHYEESLPIIRAKFLVGVLEGRVCQKRVNERAQAFGLTVDCNQYIVASIYAEDTAPQESSRIGNPELVLFSVENIATEVMERYCHAVLLSHMDYVVIIGYLQESGTLQHFLRGLEEICQRVHKYVGLNLSIGAGSPCNSFAKLDSSYKSALTALEYRVLVGNNKVIYIEDVEPDSKEPPRFLEDDERELLHEIRLGSEESIKTAVEHILSKLSEPKIDINDYQVFLVELLTSLLKLLRTYKLGAEEIFGQEFDYYGQLMKFGTLAEAQNWFTTVCLKIGEQVRRERVDASKQLAIKAKEYILLHYPQSDLSVESLCSHLHVSTGYFSAIFKKEIGTTFINYLTEVRMQAAVDLLNTTDDKTYIIAEKVGYSEPNYFSYVFKRKFNVSPSKYRNSKV